jgi:nitrogenase molybdenum-iron protein beta chain
MIGDDVLSVASEYDDSVVPVIALSTPSFKGNSYSGYEILLEGIFNRFLEPAHSHDSDLVNLFGIVPAYDPFFRGDLEEVSRLLGKFGLKVNTFFTPDQTFDNILSAPQAGLNIVLSRTYGVEFAKHFEERHQTPYWVTDLPIGADATDKFLRELGAIIGFNPDAVDEIIRKENENYYGYFSRCADLFSDGDLKYYFVTVTNSDYAIPINSFLQKELGWVGLDAFVTDTHENSQRQKFIEAFERAGLDSELLFETDTSRIAKQVRHRHPENRGERYFDDTSPLFIIGSTLEKATALQFGAQSMAVSYPVYNRVIIDRGYAGYRGGLHFFEDLLSSIVSPR